MEHMKGFYRAEHRGLDKLNARNFRIGGLW